MGHYSIASQMFDSLELKNKFILLPMEPHGQARACTPECLPLPKGLMQGTVSARRRGLLRRRMKSHEREISKILNSP